MLILALRAAKYSTWSAWFTYINSFLYYEDYDTLNDETRQMMQQSMAAFGGIAPTYHIALLDKPTIVWDFHSLLLGVQMMFSFMLTDSENPIKLSVPPIPFAKALTLFSQLFGFFVSRATLKSHSGSSVVSSPCGTSRMTVL